MMTLDDAGDSIADVLRDALDPVWHALAEDEKEFLNRRIIIEGPMGPIRIPEASLFTPLPVTPQPTRKTGVQVILDWKYAA